MMNRVAKLNLQAAIELLKLATKTEGDPSAEIDAAEEAIERARAAMRDAK